MLSATCDLYFMFIDVGASTSNPADLTQVLRTIRKSFSRTLRLILSGCLSGRATEWLPCLLTCVVLCCAVIMLADIAFAIPTELQRIVWPDIMDMCKQIKANLYVTLCHLLNALAKGSKPLKMACWRVEQVTDRHTGIINPQRNEQGLQLVGHDEASFDGVKELQQWLQRHDVLVRNVGKTWTSSAPFSMAQMPTISIAGALFDS